MVNTDPMKSESKSENIIRNLETFDDLDFNRFSKQDWEGFHRSHAQGILVHWPDGHTTTGFDRHIDDMKYMFTFAPDTRITSHPIRFGQGEWTAVTGWMEGTFTQPMKTADGTIIQPTGKSFKVPMCTIGRWKNGLMEEEYLFWDNQTYMKQLGVG